MLLNNMNITGNNGDIYYEFPNGNTIKLGTYNIDTNFNHVNIDLGDICRIEYEFRTAEMLKDCVGMTPHMYWFKSQYVSDRYHGVYSHDIKWAIELFDSVSPFNEEINNLIKTMIREMADLTWRIAIGVYDMS